MDDTETMQHKHKHKQNTKYNDQVRHIIIFHQTLFITSYYKIGNKSHSL